MKLLGTIIKSPQMHELLGFQISNRKPVMDIVLGFSELTFVASPELACHS